MFNDQYANQEKKNKEEIASFLLKHMDRALFYATNYEKIISYGAKWFFRDYSEECCEKCEMTAQVLLEEYRKYRKLKKVNLSEKEVAHVAAMELLGLIDDDGKIMQFTTEDLKVGSIKRLASESGVYEAILNNEKTGQVYTYKVRKRSPLKWEIIDVNSNSKLRDSQARLVKFFDYFAEKQVEAEKVNEKKSYIKWGAAILIFGIVYYALTSY